ncbi:hypothetical protein [Priestia megaterium]|uniref:hypothetical protein n=1 Tax=Priestia megaterium TaxID=1404 RepID=UPI00398FC7C3
MALFDERILEKEKPILKKKRQINPFSLMKRKWINGSLKQRKRILFLCYNLQRLKRKKRKRNYRR